VSEPSCEFDPIDDLADEFLARYRRGERPSLGEYTAKHPELAERIRDVFPALVAMEEVGHATGQHVGPSGSVTPMPERLGDYLLLPKTILTGSWDNTARLWDAAIGLPIGKTMRHQGFVCSVAFSPDGKSLLTGGFDKMARLWAAPEQLPDDLPRIAAWVRSSTGLDFRAASRVEDQIKVPQKIGVSLP
jgi:hypothetical protein